MNSGSHAAVWVLWVYLQWWGAAQPAVPLDHYPAPEQCVAAGRDWSARARAYARRVPGAATDDTVMRSWIYVCHKESLAQARADLKRWGVVSSHWELEP